jgi:lipoprotein-anchoring transpeptidase ErfK/SrfK
VGGSLLQAGPHRAYPVSVRRFFPAATVAVVATLGLTAVLLQWGQPAAVAAGSASLTSSSASQPVLLGAAYRDESGSEAVAPEPEPSTSAVVPSPVASAPAVATPAPTPTPSASPIPIVKKPKKPKPATREQKARHVPERPLDKNTGKRIVYDKALMTVWLMNKKNEVVGRYPVVGRWDRPAKGTYRIFSKSERSSNPNSKVTFDHMVRFTYGPDTKSAIGFHSIPRYYDGTRMHPESSLGLPIATGGCIRMADEDAKAVYDFMKVGDLVVVLPSP